VRRTGLSGPCEQALRQRFRPGSQVRCYPRPVPAPDQRPVIAVLVQADGSRPDLDPLHGRASLRFTDAAGLGEAIPGADALLLWDFFSTALRAAWPRATALRWVHTAAAGVDTLLFDELIESDVVVTNARGTFDRPMAEFALATILARVKRLHELHDRQLARHWRHEETQTLAGQTVLVVGTGSIGRATARLLRAVGMRVRGAGRTARTNDPDFGEVLASDRLVEHVGWADHVVVVAPLTEQTRGLVDAAVLGAMKPTAHLVNLGRGPIVDEHALVDALGGRGIAAASLDVFGVEPLPADHPLWTTPGVAISPHLSGDASGFRDVLARQFVDNAMRFLDGAPLDNVVDKRLGFVPTPSSAPAGTRS
jgi:phosphoglycerate dehydrogenase-like enzyme